MTEDLTKEFAEALLETWRIDHWQNDWCYHCPSSPEYKHDPASDEWEEIWEHDKDCIVVKARNYLEKQ